MLLRPSVYERKTIYTMHIHVLQVGLVWLLKVIFINLSLHPCNLESPHLQRTQSSIEFKLHPSIPHIAFNLLFTKKVCAVLSF